MWCDVAWQAHHEGGNLQEAQPDAHEAAFIALR